MKAIKRLSMTVGRRLLRSRSALTPFYQPHAGVSMRAMPKVKEPPADVSTTNSEFPRKIFSGIQPTGCLHLGNYLGAVQQWTKLQNAKEDVTFCIVDMHSLTTPQDPITLRENIFQMAAAMLACGIDPEQSTIFVQSAVKEHTELSWILGCMSTMARLGHLPQYKEKTRLVKDIPLGLFVYPVLQAADILLYKSTHVPVGEDQVQHIQLAQHLAKTFNTKYGSTFPICHAILENKNAARIRSLRDPSKKMSKSDSDQRATINLTDEPDVIVEKIKKGVTDFCSDVNYNPDTRLGVSNLIAIHSLLTGKTIPEIVDEAKTIDTGTYKMRVAEVVVEHLRPIRTKINQQLIRRNELVYLLEMGADKARVVAQQTMIDVKQRLGLGAHPAMPVVVEIKEDVKVQAKVTGTGSAIAAAAEKKKAGKFDVPEVPKQELRVEKKRQMRIEIKSETKLDLSSPQGILNVKPLVPKVDTTAPLNTASTKALVPKMVVTTGSSSSGATVDTTDTSTVADKHQKEIKI